MSQIAVIAVIAPHAQEYWCPSCRQLRLHIAGTPRECRNCGNQDNLLCGDPGTLDAEQLRGGEA